MFAVRFFIGFSCLFMISGCNNNDTGQDTEQASLPVVRGSELSAFVENSDLPVLVEFGVDYQCERCARMRSDIVDLGQRFEGRVNVVRVDYNANAQMVAELGGTICPTYVFFKDGKPVQTESFPTSADMLQARLEQL